MCHTHALRLRVRRQHRTVARNVGRESGSTGLWQYCSFVSRGRVRVAHLLVFFLHIKFVFSVRICFVVRRVTKNRDQIHLKAVAKPCLQPSVARRGRTRSNPPRRCARTVVRVGAARCHRPPIAGAGARTGQNTRKKQDNARCDPSRRDLASPLGDWHTARVGAGWRVGCGGGWWLATNDGWWAVDGSA